MEGVGGHGAAISNGRPGNARECSLEDTIHVQRNDVVHQVRERLRRHEDEHAQFTRHLQAVRVRVTEERIEGGRRLRL